VYGREVYISRDKIKRITLEKIKLKMEGYIGLFSDKRLEKKVLF